MGFLFKSIPTIRSRSPFSHLLFLIGKALNGKYLMIDCHCFLSKVHMRLNVVVYRESKSFEESLEAVREGLLSGSLLRQFEQIPTLRVDLSRATSLRRGNEAKNRYRDVLPYDDTRVKLSNNSYINASWIDIHTGNFHR